MSKLSVVALCATAVLQSHAALASSWCIDPDSASFWQLPGATAELSSTKLVLNLGDGRLVKCSSRDGAFDCATAPKDICWTSTCGFFVDTTEVSLRITPDEVVSYMLFTLCPATSTDAIM